MNSTKYFNVRNGTNKFSSHSQFALLARSYNVWSKNDTRDVPYERESSLRLFNFSESGKSLYTNNRIVQVCFYFKYLFLPLVSLLLLIIWAVNCALFILQLPRIWLPHASCFRKRCNTSELHRNPRRRATVMKQPFHPFQNLGFT